MSNTEELFSLFSQSFVRPYAHEWKRESNADKTIATKAITDKVSSSQIRVLYTNATLLLLFCSVWQLFTIKSHDCCSRRCCCCCRCFCSELLMKWKNACETKKNSKNQEQTSLTTTTTTTTTLGTVSAKCLYTHTYLNSVNIWRTDCPTEKSCKSGRERKGVGRALWATLH